jgi:hypothetical protein
VRFDVAIAHFPSLEQCELIEVTFVAPDGEEGVLSLLVDSGFTGQSCFVLSADADRFAHASAPRSQTAGALSGMQRRVIVHWRIPSLSASSSAMAILSDVSGLALPPGIHGMAGLRFLRHFTAWGAEQTEQGSWRFLLSTDPPGGLREPLPR